MEKTPTAKTSFQMKNFRANAFYSVILQFLIKAKGIISLPVVTYFMAPSELGIWKMITAAASAIPPIITLNLLDGGAVFFCETSDKRAISKMYSTIFNFILIFSLLFLLIFLWMGNRVFHLNYLFYIVIYCFTVVIDQFSVFPFIVFHKTKQLAKYKTLKEYFSFILLIVAVALGYGYKGAIISYCSVVLVISSYNLVLNFKDIGYLSVIDFKFLKEIIPQSLILLPVFSMVWIINSIDSYFIAFYKGNDQVGIYSVAYSISSLILFLSQALDYFWFPMVTRLWNADRQSFYSEYKTVFRFGVYILSIILLMMTSSSTILVSIFSQQSYFSASLILGPITLAYLFQVIIKFFTAPIYSNKMPIKILVANFTGAIFNIFLNFMFIPRYGIKGAAFNTAFSYLVVIILLAKVIIRELNIKILSLELIQILLFTWIVFSFLVTFPLQSYILIGISWILIIVFYSNVLYLRSSEREKQSVRSTILFVGSKLKNMRKNVRYRHE